MTIVFDSPVLKCNFNEAQWEWYRKCLLSDLLPQIRKIANDLLDSKSSVRFDHPLHKDIGSLSRRVQYLKTGMINQKDCLMASGLWGVELLSKEIGEVIDLLKPYSYQESGLNRSTTFPLSEFLYLSQIKKVIEGLNTRKNTDA